MGELYGLPEGWEWKKLVDKKVCELIMGQSPKSDTYNSDGNGMPFFQGKTEFGDRYPTVSKYCTAPKKIAQIGDILLSVRAPVGPTNVANIECCIGRGLGAIRPNTENTLTNYLLYFFRNFELEISQKGKGSTFSAITKKELENTDIPLPPLQEQKRIVAKLDSLFAKIDQAIALHQQNIDEAEGFMGSVLNEVFGELEGKYSQVPLFEVANVARGKSKHRPRNDKKLFGGDYPFIQTGDVRNANKYIKTYSNTYSDFGLKQSKLWESGTICMTVAANIGDVAILGMDSCFPDSVVGIYSDKNSNDFIYYFLLTLKQQLESKATTTAQMNINLKVLQTIGVPLPPLSIQQKTVTYLDQLSQKTEKLKQVQNQKMESLKALKASILDQAFRGEI